MFLSLFIKGIFIGIGAILPGVSGGALAVIFGIYEKILSSISNFFENPRKNFIFLLTVGAGASLGVVLFSNIQKFLLLHYETETLLVLTGLLIGTFPSLFKNANKHGFSKTYIIPFIVTLFISLAFSFIEAGIVPEADYSQAGFFPNGYMFAKLFIIGFVMAGSLVIPGISGTVLLMLMGVYSFVLNVIGNVKNLLLYFFSPQIPFSDVVGNLLILVFLGLGVLVGAVIFSKIMSFFMEKYYGFTYYAILGFVIGSVPELFPGTSFSFFNIYGIFLFFGGLFISLYFNKKFG